MVFAGTSSRLKRYLSFSQSLVIYIFVSCYGVRDNFKA